MDREDELLLTLAVRTLKFATDHPYAATGIFGAVVGSAVTYRVMTLNSLREKATKVFTPKVYELAVSQADLRRLLDDPAYELRWEMTEASVIVTAEKREEPVALLDIEYKES